MCQYSRIYIYIYIYIYIFIYTHKEIVTLFRYETPPSIVTLTTFCLEIGWWQLGNLP